MKKLVVLFILLCVSNLNAQKYTFNTLAKYAISHENKNGETASYTNSYIDSYYLKIIKNKTAITAILYDFQNLKQHTFSVDESFVNGEIIFYFGYMHSSFMQYYNKKTYAKYVYDFQTIALNDSLKKINLKVFPNSRKRKPLREFELQLKNHSLNLFPIFRINCMHPYEFLNELNNFNKGVVVNAKGTNISGKQIEYQLLELKAVNFELIVPKELKFL